MERFHRIYWGPNFVYFNSLFYSINNLRRSIWTDKKVISACLSSIIFHHIFIRLRKFFLLINSAFHKLYTGLFYLPLAENEPTSYGLFRYDDLEDDGELIRCDLDYMLKSESPSLEIVEIWYFIVDNKISENDDTIMNLLIHC